ncbi:unnamed protein product [Paramecium pentaurelia]|uniref:Uncharacterized protein n=1 Tax=Paramecium pentaurelia TaxID=43138 RepID=A0A8S1WUK8_9CILI|nr:unnamed protein product [Paramecium pentaurelia]
MWERIEFLYLKVNKQAIKLVNLRNLRCLEKQLLLLQNRQYKLSLIQIKCLHLIKVSQNQSLIKVKQILKLIKGKQRLNMINVMLLIRVTNPKADQGKDEIFPIKVLLILKLIKPKSDQGNSKPKEDESKIQPKDDQGKAESQRKQKKTKIKSQNQKKQKKFRKIVKVIVRVIVRAKVKKAKNLLISNNFLERECTNLVNACAKVSGCVPALQNCKSVADNEGISKVFIYFQFIVCFMFI